MPTTDQERLWAHQLQKNKDQERHTETVDWGLKAASIVQDMAHTKKQLKQALEEKNTKTIETCTATLIRLRAEQFACALQQYRREVQKIDPDFIARLLSQYKKDCLLLIQAIQADHA